MFAREILASVFVTLVLAGLTALPVAAQTPMPNEINAVAKELWCPLCNGVRLDNCELQACVQMREVIAQKLEAGESKEQIKAYFVQQYGDVVLGAPAREGFDLLVWVLPIFIGVVGLGWLAFFVRAGLQRRSVLAKVSSTPAKPTAKTQDDYLKRVEDELEKEQ
jgi:cytochrome c-type biogenesis protein CcmH